MATAEVGDEQFLERLLVPARLSLICRGDNVLGYNPAFNVWHRIDPAAAAMLRWLRAGRDRQGLRDYVARHTPLGETGEPLIRTAEKLVLRRLLYLDHEPALQPVVHPDAPLGTVYWITTQKCNLRCTYCYQDAARPRAEELSTDEGKAVIDQAHAAGAQTFVFTGGEPFSRRDLLELAAYSKSKGLRTNVITNGAFINVHNIDRVASIFDLVTVSLDHLIPEHHDRIRGHRSWEKAIRAIDLLLEAGVSVDINSVLSRHGIEDLAALVGLRRAKRIGMHKIVPQFPMGRGGTSRGDELSANQLLGLSDQMAQVSGASRPGTPGATEEESTPSGKGDVRDHCGAGLSEVSVDPEGWVYPCKLLQYPELRAGNIRDTSIATLYATDPILQKAQASTSDVLPTCRTCIIQRGCGGGCRGIHYSFTGHYDEAAPIFCSYLRRTFEVKAWRSTGEVPAARRNEWADPSIDGSSTPAVMLGMPTLRSNP
ncbi:radical SAM/SPASM domain-containing protein [Raineyella fluvialis]|uniref:Radical SAM protein n=1 Tax=Raineyella fluvialis TaxID=2662261 RepID=A0A5Q2FA38_9ACTN|nr:radical SAM protein [Raineyella fluvialis]QGF23772.1 radical SAM protein [Raineyella fluvialis]